MTPRHHPSEARLVDFAMGSLPPGPHLIVGCHVGACEACARTVRTAEAVAGVLLEDAPPAAISPEALDLALARIERPAGPQTSAAGLPSGWIATPGAVIRAYRRQIRRMPGVWMSPIARGPGRSRTYLLGIAPGVSVPRHSHRGAEMTCVLKGGFYDGRRHYDQGDFAEADGAVRHRPQVTGGVECVCLISTDAPLRGLDLLGRLVIPMMGV